jgi:hypothetical protein
MYTTLKSMWNLGVRAFLRNDYLRDLEDRSWKLEKNPTTFSFPASVI